MKVEIRNDKVVIDGYVNAVGRDSKPLFDAGQEFVEQITPGVFARALREGGPVSLLLNHDRDRVLGSTDENLTLQEDSIGLRAHCEITDAEVIQKARERKLRGWSFGFWCTAQRMEERAGDIPRRHVDGLSLFEVSIIDDRKIPAYDGTLIESRATGEATVFAHTTEEEVTVTENIIDLSEIRERINKLIPKEDKQE